MLSKNDTINLGGVENEMDDLNVVVVDSPAATSTYSISSVNEMDELNRMRPVSLGGDGFGVGGGGGRGGGEEESEDSGSTCIESTR